MKSLECTNNFYVDHEVVLYENDWIGYPKAVNNAIKEVNGIYTGIVLLNDDCVPLHSGWLNELTDCGQLTGVIAGANHTLQRNIFGNDHLTFWCVYIPKGVLDRVGLLDEKFGMGNSDDIDYCWRTLKEGFSIEERPNVKVLHRGSRTFIQMEKEKRGDFEKTKQENNAYLRSKWNL